MSEQPKSLGFIGGGNMAQALIQGLINGGFDPSRVFVSDPSEDVQAHLKALGVSAGSDPKAVFENSSVVVLAIKPQLMDKVLPGLKDLVTPEHVVVSVAAGMSTAAISSLLGGHSNVVRAMPNTPAFVGQGATGLYAADVSDQAKAHSQFVFEASGSVVWVESEQLMHAVTAVSGSAPAYFFYFVEHMVKAAADLGLKPEDALTLARQTALGAATMLYGDDSAQTLRTKVTSPNGTTHAAVETLKQHQVGEHIEAAMKACAARSLELSGD